MENEGKIRLAENFVREKMSYFDSGHDWWHIERVRKIAHYINKELQKVLFLKLPVSFMILRTQSLQMEILKTLILKFPIFLINRECRL
jgi:hypothetical protein